MKISLKGIFQLICWIVILISACTFGGLCNRYRGGWSPFNNSHYNPSGGDIITHNAINRLVWSVYAGIVFFVCYVVRFFSFLSDDEDSLGKYGKCKYTTKYFLYSLLLVCFTFFSLFVGWGTYMSIGRDNSPGRQGIFDFFIGSYLVNSTMSTTDLVPNDSVWSFTQLWFHDFSGMSLRGLIWTVPSGTLLFLASSNYSPWGFALSGICMGLAYEIAWDIPIHLPDFGQGTELAEFFWGFFLTFSLFSSIMGNYPGCYSVSLSKYVCTSKGKIDNKYFSCFVILFSLLLFVGCTIYYSFVTQEDIRNKDQTFIGLLVSAVWLGVITLIYGYYVAFVSESPKKEDETTPLQNHSFSERFAADVSITTINVDDSIDDDPEEDRDFPLHWKMFTLFSLFIRLVSVLLIVAVLGTSLTSCIWYYAITDKKNT